MINCNLNISANYEALRTASEAVRSVLIQAGATEDTIGVCDIALQELLTNLVEHAYQEDDTKSIQIRIWIDNNRLYVETMDTGENVDLDLEAVRMPDPLDLQEGGYGMAIIKSIMDKVDYLRRDNTNIWRIEKSILS